MQIKVFHVLLLELTLKGVPLEKKIEINVNENKYDVEEVMDLKKGKNMFEYLIKWLDYSSESNL